MGAWCFWRWPSGVSAWPTSWPGCSRIGAIRRGSCTALSICSALACSRSAAATRTPTTSIICGPIPHSSWPADGCRTRAGICVPNRSRLENSPRLRDVIRLTYTLVDTWMDSYPCEPASVTLDIDDTCDVVHGHQQLSLFNAHYDERCFLPIHVYDTEKSRPVAVVLRPGKTPGGVEVRAHIRRLVRHIRTRWHKTRITFRGDGHYARPEAMTWCENNGIDYIFGLSGTKPLARKVDEVADDIRTRRAFENLP